MLGGHDKKLIALIANEVRDIAWQWAQGEAEQVVQQDMDSMERSVQALLRLLGGAVMARLAEASVAHHGGTRPDCPHCGRPMRLVERQRGREMHGLVGDFAFGRPYYQCRRCGGGTAPDDERLGIGTVSHTPALSRVAAMTVTEVPFERAARNLSETLGATFAEAEIYRVVEALGMVAEAEIKAGMTAPEADPATPAGNTLLIGMDGTTSFIDGDWHEVKVGVVGMLGPELQHDAETRRDLFKVSDPRYCAAVATEAGEFFPRVALLARQAGLGHPGLHRVVCLGDGGRWIWNRTSVFRQDGVEHIEILDYMHASEHVWQVADVFFGEGTLDAHAWVGPVLRALLDQGPTPLLEALGTLRPRSAKQKRELQNARDYFTANRDRMRYPDFIAEKLPIGSGVVEATCRSLVCQRTKGAGMRWTRAGAQAVLNLRCLHLSHPDRWRSFFARHPLRNTPHLVALRQPQTQAA